MSIEETENEIVEEFELFDDWTDKYEFIIELGQKLPPFPAEDMVEANKIKGCQSSVWFTSYFDGKKITFQSTSDSSIVKGLAALLIRVLSQRTPSEILHAPLHFIEKIGLAQHLAPTRANGLGSMIKQLKATALVYNSKQ